MTLTSGASLAAQAMSATTDTITVGSVPLRLMSAGADTFDISFESPGPAGATQRVTNVGVDTRTTETLNGQPVLHFHFGARVGKPSYDFYVDPRTMATRRFEQSTPIDSAIVTAANGCVSGWAELEHEARRTITCDRATDRFGGSPIEESIIAMLPLKAGMSAVLSTYGAITSTLGGYAFHVVGAESLQLGDRRFDAWRVEHAVTNGFGTYSTILWVDQHQPRVLQTRRDFGNGRRSTSTLRNR